MFVFFFLLFLGFIAFLFCLYLLGKDDMVFMRKNVTLEDLFNLAFLTVGVSIFFARVFFVAFHFSTIYLNPLVFFLLVYYPGLSFPGGLFAGSMFLLLLARRKKFPIGHIVDFFGLALLVSLPFGFIATSFIEPFTLYKHVFLPLIITILFLFGIIFLVPRIHRHELKTGTLGTASIVVVSFINLLTTFLGAQSNGFGIAPSDILSLITFLAALFFFVKQEYVLMKVKK